MKTKVLYVLYFYQFFSKKNDGISENEKEKIPRYSYSILKIFSPSEFIDSSDLEKIYERLFSRKYPNQFIGRFDGVDEIATYCSEVARKMGCEKVHMMSVEDYNIGLEIISKVDEFSSIFEEFGRKIVLGRKKSLENPWSETAE